MSSSSDSETERAWLGEMASDRPSDESDSSMRKRLVDSLSQSFPGSALSKALHLMEPPAIGLDEVDGDKLSSSCYAEIRLEKGPLEDDELTSLSWLQGSDILKNIANEEEKATTDDGQKENGLETKTVVEVVKPIHPHHVVYNPMKHINSKPPYSFSCLIFMAVEDSPNKRLPVKDIYNWILTHFPYFQNAPTGWKNSVRHNLSLNKCFKKVDKDKGHSIGKGSLWCIDPDYRPNLLQALRKTPYHPYHQLQMMAQTPPNYGLKRRLLPPPRYNRIPSKISPKSEFFYPNDVANQVEVSTLPLPEYLRTSPLISNNLMDILIAKELKIATNTYKRNTDKAFRNFIAESEIFDQFLVEVVEPVLEMSSEVDFSMDSTSNSNSDNDDNNESLMLCHRNSSAFPRVNKLLRMNSLKHPEIKKTIGNHTPTFRKSNRTNKIQQFSKLNKIPPFSNSIIANPMRPLSNSIIANPMRPLSNSLTANQIPAFSNSRIAKRISLLNKSNQIPPFSNSTIMNEMPPFSNVFVAKNQEPTTDCELSSNEKIKGNINRFVPSPQDNPHSYPLLFPKENFPGKLSGKAFVKKRGKSRILTPI